MGYFIIIVIILYVVSEIITRKQKEEEEDSQRFKHKTEKTTEQYTRPVKPQKFKKKESPKKNKKVAEEEDFLKKMGDEYERYIGIKFEEKGDLVIYNGFIKAYKDNGVDVITISPTSKIINLIQCKNWRKKAIKIEDIETIFAKLDRYSFDFYDVKMSEINTHLKIKKDAAIIANILRDTKINPQNYTIRKTLYASSEKVVDLEVGKHLKMINKNIFRYEDMKVVFVEGIS